MHGDCTRRGRGSRRPRLPPRSPGFTRRAQLSGDFALRPAAGICSRHNSRPLRRESGDHRRRQVGQTGHPGVRCRHLVGQAGSTSGRQVFGTAPGSPAPGTAPGSPAPGAGGRSAAVAHGGAARVSSGSKGELYISSLEIYTTLYIFPENIYSSPLLSGVQDVSGSIHPVLLRWFRPMKSTGFLKPSRRVNVLPPSFPALLPGTDDDPWTAGGQAPSHCHSRASGGSAPVSSTHNRYHGPLSSPAHDLSCFS